MPKNIFILAIYFTILFTPSIALACSCATPRTAKEGLEKSTAVFLATVNKVDKGKYEYLNTYHFNIEKSWKGETEKTFVHKNSGKSMCAYSQFKNGETYLIYANKPWDKEGSNKYNISFCSRTKKAEDAQIEMRYLDAIKNNETTKTIDKSLINILQNSKDEKEIAEALQIIKTYNQTEKPNDKTINAIISLIPNDSTIIEKTVATTLGNYNLAGNQNAIDTLITLIKDNDPNVYMSAVYSLKIIGRKSEQIYSIIKQKFDEYSAENQTNNNQKHQSYIASFLSAMADTAPENKQAELLDLLIFYVPKLDGYAKISPIQKIGFMGDKALKAVPLLLEELKNSNEETFGVRQYVIMALGLIGAQEVVGPVANYITDKNCYVVKETAIALKKISGTQAVIIIKEKAMPEMIRRFDKCTYEFSQAFTELKELAKTALPILIKKYNAKSEQPWTKDIIKQAINNIDSSAYDFAE